MKREVIDSSIIASVGYDAEKSILEIEFRNTGAVWQYMGVPETLYNALMSSDSYGSFFNAHIKGRYWELKVG
jgi:hypothetical protein